MSAISHRGSLLNQEKVKSLRAMPRVRKAGPMRSIVVMGVSGSGKTTIASGLALAWAVNTLTPTGFTHLKVLRKWRPDNLSTTWTGRRGCT